MKSTERLALSITAAEDRIGVFIDISRVLLWP